MEAEKQRTLVEAVNKLLEELNLPLGQGWVGLDQLIKKAEELDGDKE